MCGEQNQLLMDQVPIPGSPPRVRGTAGFHFVFPHSRRITPACAGNSYPPHFMIFPMLDHPRVCGEQSRARGKRLFAIGSPPRVRGTATPVARQPRSHGITPACAGNSQALTLDLMRDEDHPRVCGEQLHRGSNRQRSVGSPPRVRGTAAPAIVQCQQARITPACAGNRFSNNLVHITVRDHPRVCGEQQRGGTKNVFSPGSPPRVRGTEGSGFGDVLDNRITPACAGNRKVSLPITLPNWDHPRVCGEQFLSL